MKQFVLVELGLARLSPLIRRAGAVLSLLALAAVADFGASAEAQPRAAENVVRQAEDAFGASVGRETIGLYTSSNVRGFSPTTAGNARIDGLYFDQVADIDARLRRATAIRVGFSAFGFLFPAPTGVLDYQLRRPGSTPSRNVYASVDTFGNVTTEAEATLPLSQQLSLGMGAGVNVNEFANGTDSFQHVVAAQLRWQPHATLDIMPFVSRADLYDNDAGPNLVPATSTLPPPVARRKFRGPGWAAESGVSSNYGVVTTWRPASAWVVRAGAFRSVKDEDVGYANVISAITPQGLGRQSVSIDPPGRAASTSGELRLTHILVDGPRLHQFHLSARGRDRARRFGGSTTADLGLIALDTHQTAPRPQVTFGAQSRDQVRQGIVGVAYEGRWRDRGELSLGVQTVQYRMRTRLPGAAPVTSKADPLLWNAAISVNATREVAIYAGATRGLEESGIAPATAANRNAALPAIETEQLDAGMRWRIRPGLNLIAGVFDIQKPYFNLDEASVWRELGEVRNRGLEASLSGEVRPGLTLLAGAVLVDAEVSGDAVRLGRVGRRPLGSSSRTILFNADWSPQAFDGKTSLDFGVSHSGDIVATRDNLAIIPARTTLDLGLRYRFELAGSSAMLRAQVKNVTDEGGFSLRGGNAFGVTSGRVFAVSVAADL